MARNRSSSSAFQTGPTHLSMTGVESETMREGSAQRSSTPTNNQVDGVSTFWRIFGGTILSICALVAMTIYQQFAASLVELRAGLQRLNEQNVEMVKKGDLDNRTTPIWAALKDVTMTLPELKTKTMLLATQFQQAEQERKELYKELHNLRERLAVFESRQPTTPTKSPGGD